MSIGVDSWFTVFGFGAGAGELRQDVQDLSGFTGFRCSPRSSSAATGSEQPGTQRSCMPRRTVETGSDCRCARWARWIGERRRNSRATDFADGTDSGGGTHQKTDDRGQRTENQSRGGWTRIRTVDAPGGRVGSGSDAGTAGLRIERMARIRAGGIPVQTAFLGGFATWREMARGLGCFC